MIAIRIDDTLLSHDTLLTATLRLDLVPVPMTLEFSVKMTDETKSLLQVGKEILIGEDELSLELLKVQPYQTEQIREGERIGGVACVAISKGLKKLIEPVKNAIILDQASFNQALRASGATVALSNNLPLPRFVCLKGSVPTERIASYLGEESAVIKPNKNKIDCVKLDSLFKQEPVGQYNAGEVQWVEHPTLKENLITSYISVDEKGETVVAENTTAGRPIGQKARLDSRQLKNLEKVLVHQGTLTRPYDAKLEAGQLVEIDSKNYVILTSVNHFETGALGGEPVMMTKCWLSALSK